MHSIRSSNYIIALVNGDESRRIFCDSHLSSTPHSLKLQFTMSTNISPNEVYLGHWIKWSYGPVRGSTLTLTQQHGALLTAFIAMFIGWAGTRIWRIFCFMVYSSLSKEDPQDAIYHQGQAVFRNAE